VSKPSVCRRERNHASVDDVATGRPGEPPRPRWRPEGDGFRIQDGTGVGWIHGARLSSDLRAAGLVELHADYVACGHPGGSLISRLLSLTIERLRERMVLQGADDDEIDEARRLLEEPATTIASPTSCVARGRRPGPS
jgi:hypothetical protein